MLEFVVVVICRSSLRNSSHIFHLDILLTDRQVQLLRVPIDRAITSTLFSTRPLVSIHPDDRVLPSRHHSIPMNIDPETHALFVTLHSLQHVLAHHIPEHDTSIFTSRSDERLTIKCSEAASNGEFLIAMALVCLLDGARDVVPETDAVVEVEGEHIATIRGEADVCDGGVIFMDEGSETLTC